MSERLYTVIYIHGDGVHDTWGIFDSLDAARVMLAKVQASLDESERRHTSIESYPRNPIDPDDAHSYEAKEAG